MEKLKSPVDIFKLLDKSNCRECGFPTCMAFAAAVFNGQKKLSDCPHLDAGTIEKYEGIAAARSDIDEAAINKMEEMKQEVARIDLEAAAQRLRAPYRDGRITINCLGKNFNVAEDGRIFTDIHVNPWIAGPVFQYILHGEGLEPTGNWVAFRELKDGFSWESFFHSRCEEACREVADANPDFFDDLVSMWSGTQVEEQFESDISLVLRPLPLVPMMICYWKADEGMESQLNFFFDETADRNLDTGSLFRLTTGLVIMFQKIMLKHTSTAS